MVHYLFFLDYIDIKYYDWKSRSVNISFIVLYIALCIYELYIFSSPAYLVDYDTYTISKGIMFDLLVWSLPSIYVLLRLALVVPLLNMAIVKSQEKNRGNLRCVYSISSIFLFLEMKKRMI